MDLWLELASQEAVVTPALNRADAGTARWSIVLPTVLRGGILVGNSSLKWCIALAFPL